jgi:hypothetical protein
LDLIFQDVKVQNTLPIRIEIDDKDIDAWKEFTIPISLTENLRLVLFSGSAEKTPNYVIKDIVIKN